MFFSFNAGEPNQQFRQFPVGGPTQSPQFVASTNASSTTSPVSGTAPAGTEPGVFLLAVGAFRGTTLAGKPSDWIWVQPPIAGTESTSPGRILAYKFATSADLAGSTTYAFTGLASNGSLHIAAFRNVDPISPIISIYPEYAVSGNFTEIPSVLANANGLILACGAANSGNNSLEPIFTFGSPFTKLTTELNNSRVDAAIGSTIPVQSGEGPTATIVTDVGQIQTLTTFSLRGRQPA